MVQEIHTANIVQMDDGKFANHQGFFVGEGFPARFGARGFSDASSCFFGRGLRAASKGFGRAGRAHQKGCEFACAHGPEFFSRPDRCTNRCKGRFSMIFPHQSSGGSPMEQRELALMGRLDGPSVAPLQLVKQCRTYREAVRLSWDLRRVKRKINHAAALHGLIPQHASDYINPDDKPGRRDLPAEAIKVWEFEVVGNTIVSQWLAWQSALTVLEEMQATRAAA